MQFIPSWSFSRDKAKAPLTLRLLSCSGVQRAQWSLARMPAGEEHHRDALAPGGYHIWAIPARRHIPSLAPQSPPGTQRLLTGQRQSHPRELPPQGEIRQASSPGWTQQGMLAPSWDMSRALQRPHRVLSVPPAERGQLGKEKKRLYTNTALHSFVRWAATSAAASKANLVDHSKVSAKTKSRFWRGD